jgi:hypothetical protein
VLRSCRACSASIPARPSGRQGRPARAPIRCQPARVLPLRPRRGRGSISSVMYACSLVMGLTKPLPRPIRCCRPPPSPRGTRPRCAPVDARPVVPGIASCRWSAQSRYP